jgi:hypothetical protein
MVERQVSIEKTALAEPIVKAITWRSLLLGLLAIIINTYWVTVVEVRWYSLDGSCLPIFITPVFILLVPHFAERIDSMACAPLRFEHWRTNRGVCDGLHFRNPFGARHASEPFRADEPCPFGLTRLPIGGGNFSSVTSRRGLRSATEQL